MNAVVEPVMSQDPALEVASGITAAEALRYNLWRNIKNGNLYEVVCEAPDFTNARNGQTLVLYHSFRSGDQTLGAREKSEFHLKFEKVIQPTPAQ